MSGQPKASIQMEGLGVIPKQIKPAYPLFPNFLEREEPPPAVTKVKAHRKSFLDSWGRR